MRPRPAGALRTITAASALLLGTLLVPVSSGTASAAICGSVPQTGPVNPTDLQVAGADTTTPMLSGIVSSDIGTGLVTGNIYLTDAAGKAVGATPTATGSAASGSRVTWQVPPGTLTPGSTYNWRMASPRGCATESTTGPSFTVPSSSGGSGSPAPGTTVTLSGAALAVQSGISGSSTALSTGAPFKVGGDGTQQWLSSLKADLSSVPAGSAITAATLNLTPSVCLGSCAADNLTVGQATGDVAGAATGSGLSSLGQGMTASAAETATSVDLTTLAGAWLAGDVPNDGVLLTGSANAPSGESYSAATLTVTYNPPVVPTAPQTLKLTPGDGGVIVGWAEPASTGYLDASSGNDGITGYTVTATDPSGHVTASVTTTDTSTVLSGLTNATSYGISVTAANPVGSGPSATATTTPEAVPGGKQPYIDAVAQYLNGRNALQMGQATTATAATAGDSRQSMIVNWLGNEAAADAAIASYAASNQQQDTNDVTTLSNVLVALDPTGGTVNVYATAHENFTTVDTSSGTAQSIPGSETDPVEYSFTTGTSPVITNYTDASAVVVPVSTHTSTTAFSAALDTAAETSSTAPGNVTVDSTGDHFAAVPAGTIRPMYHYGNLGGIVNWANSHWDGSYNGFSDDCTDFASRAMHYGGGMPENVAPAPILQYTNDAYWFQYTYWYGLTKTSYSWAGAWHLSNYENGQGAWFLPYVSWAAAGDLIWANWSGGGWTGISHTGVIALNTGSNLYIDQHSNSRYHEPLWKVAGQQTWQGSNPYLKVWIAQPYERN